MALTINNFWGAETGGLEEVAGTIGSPSVSAGAAHSGGYGYSLPASTQILFQPFESVADAGDGYICGFWFRVVSGIADPQIFFAYEGGSQSNQIIDVSLASDGDIEVRDAAVSLVGTTTSQPISADTWYFIEIYFQHAASANWEIFLDGTSVLSGSADDLDSGGTFDTTAHQAITNTGHFDDIYFLSGVTDPDNDRLGDAEVFAYRSTLASATPDSGSALDSGTWANLQEVPFNETNVGVYSGGAQSGAITTDDAGGSAGTGGPNTDANIDGDSNIIAHKGIVRMQRDGGSGTDHFIRLGNSTQAVGSMAQSADLDPTTSYANYAFVTTSGLPSSSQYGRVGIEKSSGGQDFNCSDMLYTLLHVPDAGPATPGIIFNPLRPVQHLLVR